MATLFKDIKSGIKFNADYNKVQDILIDLERRSQTEFVTWLEYYERLNLPVPLIAKSLPIIGRPEHKYCIEFELLPCEDYICILLHN